MSERDELPEGVPELRPWFTSMDDFSTEFVWREFWGNDNPIELDIGAGRGLFILKASQENPNRNYLGFEQEFQEGRRAARRFSKRHLSNARMVGGDALTALKKLIPPHSVEAVHIYFPDPWWRRRHRRRRIFTDVLVDLCARALKPLGHLHAWTDVADYFEVMQSLVNHHAEFEPLAAPAERTPKNDEDYHTSFERKKRLAGATIYRGLWQRRTLEKTA